MPITISPSSSCRSARSGLNSSSPASPWASSQTAVRSVCVRWAARSVCGEKGSGRRWGKKPRMSVTPVISAIQSSARGSEYCQANSAATPQFSRYCTASTGPMGRIDSRSTSHWISKRSLPPPTTAGAVASPLESTLDEVGVEFIGESTI